MTNEKIFSLVNKVRETTIAECEAMKNQIKAVREAHLTMWAEQDRLLNVAIKACEKIESIEI